MHKDKSICARRDANSFAKANKCNCTYMHARMGQTHAQMEKLEIYMHTHTHTHNSHMYKMGRCRYTYRTMKDIDAETEAYPPPPPSRIQIQHTRTMKDIDTETETDTYGTHGNVLFRNWDTWTNRCTHERTDK